MSAEELDLHAQYQRNPTVTPTVIVQLVEGKLLVTTGPRPVSRDEYIYDWDTVWNEPGSDVVAVDFTVQFQKTVSDQPVMVQRILDEVEGKHDEDWDILGLGAWVMAVLHGKDPR